MSTAFKVCPHCLSEWPALESFLSDPAIELTGYQVNFSDLKGGLFYFTHTKQTCGTTLAIEVTEFTGLSSRPMLTIHAKQPGCCPGLCTRKGSLDPCPEQCECVWVREVMQAIRNWKTKKH